MSSTAAKPLKIILTGQLRDTLTDEVQAIAPNAEVVICDRDEIVGHIPDARIVVTNVLSDAALDRARGLQWVHTWAAGPDQLLTDRVRQSSLQLTCCKGNGAVPLAEHAMMLMLMLDRDARRALANQANRGWDRYYHGELNGKTCGIIGTGHSGTDLARKAAAFGMRTLGMRRTAAPAPLFDAMFAPDQLTDFLRECDFVVVTAPLTPRTRGMLDRAAFRAMKPTARYICFSRGAIAAPGALETALQQGWIAGAGLDAHAVEPLPQDSPLWDMPNVVITPHHGALSPETRQRGYDIFLENLRRFGSGRDLRNPVDREQGY